LTQIYGKFIGTKVVKYVFPNKQWLYKVKMKIYMLSHTS
jgi:hypothetical protein